MQTNLLLTDWWPLTVRLLKNGGLSESGRVGADLVPLLSRAEPIAGLESAFGGQCGYASDLSMS